ncbi:efflux RND transporter permease subunit [Klebsiella variicola subsp. variicola]|nr:efflux RND transporter permease subunit [Klebsiella variicola subsp. variicola]
MRNTLILIGQIHRNEQAGLDPFHAVVEATVQRARPVLLTALAAITAFIPLTHSVFWGTLAYTLIGGTLGNHRDPYFPAGHVRDLVPHPTSAPG